MARNANCINNYPKGFSNDPRNAFRPAGEPVFFDYLRRRFKGVRMRKLWAQGAPFPFLRPGSVFQG